MVGQKALINKIDSMRYCPRSILLVGDSGCEQEGVITYLGRKFGLDVIPIQDISVGSIRELIDVSYHNVGNVLYVIYNADDLSLTAKNALLKVLEEPPNNSRFLFIVENLDNILYTIRSRSYVMYLDTYTYKQLSEYFRNKPCYVNDLEEFVVNCCQTPGDIDGLCQYNIYKFKEYVEKVIDNIDKVSGSNCFKIAKEIAVKATDAGYDIRLFLRAFISICNSRVWIDPKKYTAGVFATARALKHIRNRSFNRQMIFDEWILDIRADWGCGGE